MDVIHRIFKNKWYPPADILAQDVNFLGQTIIITGSSSGLGFATALKFASLQASRLILAVRDEQKEVWNLEMGSYDSVKRFAKRAGAELDRVDIIILNAGTYSNKFDKSHYGWEKTLQINVLSTVLLALLMLPQLEQSATTTGSRPVLELVSSGLIYRADISPESERSDSVLLEEFNSPVTFQSGLSYRISKLFVTYAIRSISNMVPREFDGTPKVIVTSVCPGACQSGLSRELSGIIYRILKFIASILFLRTAIEGSRTLVSGTTLGPKAHGEFWQNDQIRGAAPALQGSRGKRLQARVWHEVLDALRRDVPDTMDLVRSREPR